MDPEVIKKAQEMGMTPEQAEALQEIVDATGLSVEEAFDMWK